MSSPRAKLSGAPSGTIDPDRSSAQSARMQKAAIGMVAVGAGVVLLSGFLVWFEILGSELTGFEMADILTDIGDDLSVTPPSWMGAAWYALPAMGIIAWIVLFARQPVRSTLVHAAIGTVIVVAVAIYMLVVADRATITPGPVVALAGGLVVTVGGFVGVLGRKFKTAAEV